MGFFSSLKGALHRGINAGKAIYNKAHSIHETYHNYQDKWDRFQARREAQHVARPVNREVNRSTTKRATFIQEATKQANMEADRHGYDSSQREALKQMYLKKYEAEATKREKEATERRSVHRSLPSINHAGLKVVNSIGNRPKTKTHTVGNKSPSKTKVVKHQFIKQ